MAAMVISPPFEWQSRYNASDVDVRNRMDTPVDPAIVAELGRKFTDFVRGTIVRNRADDSGLYVTSETFARVSAAPKDWLREDFIKVEKVKSI